MTYTELVQKIRDYTEVTSTVLTDTIVNGFIENAEYRIFYDIPMDSDRVEYEGTLNDLYKKIRFNQLYSRKTLN